MSQHSQTIGLVLQTVMDLQRHTGVLQATVGNLERRLRIMEKRHQQKSEAPSWISQLPISEMVLLAFLMLSGVVMHLMPSEWRDDLRAVITAMANK